MVPQTSAVMIVWFATCELVSSSDFKLFKASPLSLLQDDSFSGEFPGSGEKDSPETKTNDDKCEPNPCQNGGTCVVNYDLIDGYKCECEEDFGGITCNG